jgi:hypothetical protein
MYRQKLADIGRGMYRGFFEGPVYIPLLYDLGAVSRRAGYKVNKDDPWRLWYGLLYDVPLVEWPSFTTTVPKLDKKERPTGEMVTLHGGDAIRYALADPVATDNAYVKQAQKYDPALLRDEFAQARKYWALDLASTWGIRTSLAGALSLETGVKLRIEQLKELLLKPARAGAVGPLVRDDGSRDTKAAKAYMRIVCSEATPPIPLRLTKGGKKGIKDVCLDNDACQNTLDPLLMAYAEYASMFKVLSNDVEMLKKGTLWPIHCHFDLAETGRTTCAKPNLQNPRRLAGVREAFVPRGYAA